MIRDFIIYRPATGEIVSTARGTERSVARDLKPGEAMLEGRADPARHRIEGGALVARGADALADPAADLAAAARARRTALLTASDWTQIPDAPVRDPAAWRDYRQALREITDQPNFPHEIVWPRRPDEEGDSR